MNAAAMPLWFELSVVALLLAICLGATVKGVANLLGAVFAALALAVVMFWTLGLGLGAVALAGVATLAFLGQKAGEPRR